MTTPPMPRLAARLAALLGVASLAACGSAAADTGTAATDEFSSPGGIPDAAVLDVYGSATDLTVRSAPEGPLSVITVDRTDHASASVDEDAGAHDVALHLRGGGRIRVDIVLNQRAVWTLRIHDGSHAEHLELEQTRLAGLRVDGATSSLEMRLPPPRHDVAVTVTGDAGTVLAHLPQSVPVALSMHGGARGLTFDNQELGGVGGARTLQSDGYGQTPDRYSMTLDGTVSTVVVDRR